MCEEISRGTRQIVRNWEKECQLRNKLVAVTRSSDCLIKHRDADERLCKSLNLSCWSETGFQPGEGPVNSGGNYDPLKVA